MTSAKIEAHRAALDKDYNTKNTAWNTALSSYQSSSEQVSKVQARIDNASRKMGGSSYNADGSLSYFVGYESESHHRSPRDICRDLHRYICTDMLKLRQNRVETILQELSDSFDFEVASGRGQQEPGLVTNMSATKSVLNLLVRRGGLTLTKGEIIRQLVSFFCDIQLISSFITYSYTYLNL